VVFSDQGEVMERWVFDIERMPVVGYRDRFVEFEDNGGDLDKGIKLQDLEEQFRASIRKLQYKGEQMGKLPERCTYTVAVELRDGAEAPIGGTEKEQAWEVGDVRLQREEKEGEDRYSAEDYFMGKRSKGKGREGRRGEDLGGARTNAIKLVEAGEFVMEMWVEESQAKLDFEKEARRATVEDGEED
jgi:mitotic spindle assembly checkpoint protein MAD2B